MIEMVSDNIAMQRNQYMCKSQPWIVTHLVGLIDIDIWKIIMFTKDDRGFVSGVHDESDFWFGG